MWSGVSEFAAYFRIGIAEVRGKTEICRADPGFTPPRPAVLLPKIAVCSVVSDFSPHFRKLGILSAIRSAFERQAKRAESRTISQRTCWGSVLVAALFYTSTMFNSWGADVNRCVPVLGNI